MKQQFEQLLKDAEEVTAKMREALAHMDKPEINMEHGKWYKTNMVDYWLIKFDRLDNDRVMVLDAFSISSSFLYGAGFNCFANQIKSCSTATTEDMMLLPDGHPEKPKHALAATYEEVADAVKPEWFVGSVLGIVQRYSKIYPYQLPTEAAAKQDRAYIQIKNLEAYCAAKFPGERGYAVVMRQDGKLIFYRLTCGIIKVTREAAEWLIANHPEPFLIFFGVKS